MGRHRRRRGRCAAADPRGYLGQVLGRGALAVERANCRWPRLSRRYGRMFYERLVQEEVELAGVKAGDRVLHVGCGAFPFTTLALAERGCVVVGIDRDEQAVAAARRVVSQKGLDGHVEIRHGTGESVDCADFNAVWVSLHVTPRDEVIHNCLTSLRPKGKLVLRNVAGPLKLLYNATSPAAGATQAHVRTARSQARSNLVTMVAEKLPSTDKQRVVLSGLAAGCRGTIAATGNGHPLLEPLGIRPGRQICLRCIQKLGGSVVADLDGRRVAIDRQLAEQIVVNPVSGD